MTAKDERMLELYEAKFMPSRELAEQFNMTVDEMHRQIYRMRKRREKKAGEVEA